MGKASKWFRGLFSHKKSDSQSPNPAKPLKEKRRWSFVKSYREKENSHHNDRTRASHDEPPAPTAADGAVDPEKHAIAVAAATAAVAEAAVAAAEAAAVVVKLTHGVSFDNNPVTAVSSRSGIVRSEEEWAAVRIQSAFRGCLARRALRALKGLVRLQALVRGHIERKRTAEWLYKMHTLMHAQARALAERAQISEFSHSTSSKSSHFQNPGPATPEKHESVIRSKSRKHEQSSLLRKSSSKSNSRAIGDYNDRSGDLRAYSIINGAIEDEKSDRILEIDTGKPHITPKKRNLFHSSDRAIASDRLSYSLTTSKDSTTHQTTSSYEVQSPSPLKIVATDLEENSFCTANNSPQFYSASSRGGSSRRSPFSTPTKSDGSRSFLSGYSDYPSYMACTESSQAKVRSMSAPKQRPQYERSSSTKRYSIHGFGELRESRSSVQRMSTLHANFSNKAYPGSGRLDKLGMPVGYRF
ncbi:hypothetical protein UlMin_001967 [Ulmus minor]